MKFALVFTLLFSIGIIFVTDVNAITYFPSPLKQMSDGILPENVTCTEGLVIIQKSSNSLPACVKPSSAEKLIQRGWAMDISPVLLPANDDLQSNTIISEFEIREKAIAIWQYGLDREL